VNDGDRNGVGDGGGGLWWIFHILQYSFDLGYFLPRLENVLGE
jgi:hypothetical protein